MLEDIEMSITEHLEELRQRIFYSIGFFCLMTFIVFYNISTIVTLLQLPAIGVKFLQLAPGEYFFSTVKITFYCALIATLPFTLYQILLFILPGLTQKERLIIIPILFISLVLFIIGIGFGYYILIPAALNFFIRYGANLVEPLWSFEQYFDFILLLIISTGIAFQIPIIQILLGLFKLVSIAQMISIWKYVILLSTIIGAILTPSTDPITQLLMSIAIFVLYMIGICILFFINKTNLSLY
uniref:Sec-independent translocase component C n=1 Tax=Compsopogon caeruleus TaxID=31354 RepID=A0A1Z1XAY9_9RHOD|nr:Sec-independent translocase component C [Compsopogon caeruleus]ARX96025.1 Sec-independent translocase component C [Compsopogon caeruleus]